MKHTVPFITHSRAYLSRTSIRSAFAASMTLICMLGVSQPALAVGTVAGTKIDNTAQATYDTAAGPVEIDSNTVSILIDELLDVTVATQDTGDVPTSPGATNQVTKYLVSNTGNGNEAFKLTPNVTRGGDDFNPELVSVVLDTNGNGVYDAGVDQVYVSGSNDPVIAPDKSITVFILSNIPAGQADGNRAEVNLDAQAVTGTGAAGTTFAGSGDGGGDAVVGNSTAKANASGFFIVQDAAVVFTKEAVILDPFGTAEAVPGATITYRLIARVNGSGTLSGLRVTDAIPANSSYTPGSLTLEGNALTDASDADAGAYNGTGIAVSLGSVAAGATRTVTFKVKIN